MRFTVYSNDWFLEKLDNVCQFVRDGTHGSFKDVEIGIPLLSAKDIFDGKININENSRLISIDDYNTIHKNYELTKGDILLTIVGTIGRTAMVNMDEKFTLQRSVAILRVNEQISYNFLYYYIQTSAFQNRLKSVVNQSAQGGVYLNSLKKLNIKLTADMNEQNKISSFLSIIDKKIELLEQKYQYYQEFKKYLMQQIFTQKLRFKSADGEQYSDWKERNLYEFLTEHKLKSTGNEEVYSVSVHKGLVNQKEHLGRDFSAPDTSKYNLVKPGDIVYTKSPTGDFPLGIIKQSRVDKNVIVSPLYGVFTPETYALGYILNDYFESNVNTHNYLHPIVQKGAKNTMNITNKTFLSKTLFVPTDVNEQQKIAECFSKVNDSIRNIEIQQNKVNEFKKGLLQQMFVVRINWRCNFKLAKSPSFNKHLLILKNKIIFIIIK